MSPRKRRFTEKLASWYLWHRYIGLAAAVFAAFLAVTGILLNHTEDLALPDKYVSNEVLLDFYNVEAPQNLEGQHLHGHWIVPTSQRIYIDTLPVENTSDFVAALPANFGFVIVLSDAIQLYTPEAVLIEEVPFSAGGGEITAAQSGINQGFWFSNGVATYSADSELLEIRKVDNAPDISTPTLQTVPDKLAARIGQHLRKHTISHERLLLDLHSGRLFGMTGVWFADAAGIALLLLALSGFWVWVKRAKSRKRHRQS